MSISASGGVPVVADHEFASESLRDKRDVAGLTILFEEGLLMFLLTLALLESPASDLRDALKLRAFPEPTFVLFIHVDQSQEPT